MFSSNQVSAACSVLQDEYALQFVRLHDKVWMQSPFERVGEVDLLLVIVIIIIIVVEVPVKVRGSKPPSTIFYIYNGRQSCDRKNLPPKP